MKFKVGDKVRVREDLREGGCYQQMHFLPLMSEFKERISKIEKISETENYRLEGIDYWFSSEMLEPVEEYTYEDLCNAPIGTKITFESEQVLVKNDNRRWDSKNMYRNDEDLEGFKDNDGIEGKIIKIEEPEYTTVYELKKEILDEKEKEYLSNVIRPFRDKVLYIVKKRNGVGIYYILFVMKEDIAFSFPNFEENTMYRGMKVDKEYSLEELGL